MTLQEMMKDEVGEDIDAVQAICDVAGSYSPNYYVDEIYNALKSKEKLHV